MNWHDKTLALLHLSPTEAAVLQAASTPKTVQDLARSSQISRTGINHVLKRLLREELLTVSIVGKRRLYLAISAAALSEKMQQALEAIQREDPYLKGVRVSMEKKGEFIVHVGAAEIVPAYQRIAHENKNERIRAIQHHRSWRALIEKISPEQLVAFNEAIKKNHLIIDGMLNEGAYQSYREEIEKDPETHKGAIKSLEGRMADYTVFSDDFFNYDAEIWIFKTTTLLINWREEVAIELTNANMTGFLKDMFEFVKVVGKKLDHEKALKGALN